MYENVSRLRASRRMKPLIAEIVAEGMSYSNDI